jgi:protein-disulfide isomerase
MKRIFLGLLVVTLAFSFTVSCTPQPQDLEKGIKAYLEKNPQVLKASIEAVLKEKGIRGRPPQKSLDELIKTPIKVGLNKAPTMGADNAQITIVEFSDFQCPFCSRVVPTMKQLLKDYKGKIRIAFRHQPLSFHKNAMSAAKASLAAHEQGKFWEMHDIIFENQKNLTDENLKVLAKKIGLNVSKFEKSWKSTKFDAQIQEDMKFARANGATGTPAFFVNGVYVKGARPLPYFKQLIDKLLAKK